MAHRHFTSLLASLMILSSPSWGAVIDFETLPDGTAITDNQELTAPYVVEGTTVTFGFDTNGDLAIDVNARLERRGNDPVSSYITSAGDDADLTSSGIGGQWLLRSPQGGGEPAVDLVGGDAFIVSYSGALPTGLAGGIWDVDAGELYRVDALDADGNVMSTAMSYVGPGGPTGGTADGRPYRFIFVQLPMPIKTLRITLLQSDFPNVGFGFDNFNALGEPTDPCPGDIDDSGSVGFSDLSLLLNSWGECPPIPK